MAKFLDINGVQYLWSKIRLQDYLLKKLLSFKADKADVVLKSEVEKEDAIIIATEAELISPVAAEDGSIYTDNNGAVYSL